MADQTRLDELLDQWEEAREEGQELTAEELCRDCPELVDEVKRQIEALRKIDGELNTNRGESSAESTMDEIRSQDSVAMHCDLTDLRFHARGGLGIVCAARDEKLRRDLAVKFLRRRLAKVSECRERFLVEAEVTSRLEHPGIVPVHGIGETENGRLFYAMRLIQGDTLDDAIGRLHKESEALSSEQQHTRLRDLLGHFIALCKTVAYAHNRGIVHRDIKPANVMLGRYGETILVDWGLALPVGRQGVFKQSTERTLDLGAGSGSHDSSNTGAGTLAYMSPEQATFGADLDQRSDIYSLGATLYKLITGKAAFEGRVCDVRARVIRGDFARPTEINRSAPKALEAICLKAMSAEPDQRYPTAMELAQDVDNYLADAAVSAFDEPLLRRFARWARRHWAIVQGLMGGLALVTLAVVVAALLMGRQAQRESQLREQSLSTSAKFAARTMANQVDICWRILEKMAVDPELHAAIVPINQSPLEESRWEPLQSWLDENAKEYKPPHVRAIFVNAVDGTQVARSPQFLETNDDKGNAIRKQRYESLGTNFNYRDYFHGRGQDAYDEKQMVRPPLTLPHNGAVHESTNQGALAVVFSVPIWQDGEASPIGMLGIAIELGSFASLKMELPPGQQVILVDTRQYYLERENPERHRETGEGLVLHHENMGNLLELAMLPHVDSAVLNRVTAYKKSLPDALTNGHHLDNLLREGFHDPMADDGNSRCLAAFAPVIVPDRPPEYRDTGWFLIVQQSE